MEKDEKNVIPSNEEKKVNGENHVEASLTKHGKKKKEAKEAR